MAASATHSSGKKSKPWSEVEEVALIQMVDEQDSILSGKFTSGSSVISTKRKKCNTWENVAKELNAQFIGSNWTVEQIKKKYNNLKQRAKGKFDLAKKARGQTGGGPCPAALSAAEETLLRNVDGRPFLEGLDCGIDTDAEAVESPSRTSRPPKTAKQVQSSSTISSPEVTEKQTPKSNKGKRSAVSSISTLTEKNLRLDNQRLSLEIEKLKLEISLLEKRKITEERNHILIDKQIEYYEKKIVSSFASGVPFIDNA